MPACVTIREVSKGCRNELAAAVNLDE